jgi:hypothetical protein
MSNGEFFSEQTSFVGLNLKPVAQPEGSNLAFAAIVSSAAEQPLDIVSPALVKAGLSKEDGETAMPDTGGIVSIRGSVVGYEPIQAAEDPLAFLRSVNDAISQDHTIAFRHSLAPADELVEKARQRRRAEPIGDTNLYWSLICGAFVRDDIVTVYQLMDPRIKNRPKMLAIPDILNNIKHTIHHHGRIAGLAIKAVKTR